MYYPSISEKIYLYGFCWNYIVNGSLASNIHHYGNFQPLVPWYFIPYHKPVPFSKAEVQSYPMGVSVYGARHAYLESVVSSYNDGGACNQEGVLVPNPGDCGSFLICANKKFVTQPCASGLHFDTKIKSCNFPEAADCNGSSDSGSEEADSGVVSVGEQKNGMLKFDLKVYNFIF